MSCDYLAEYVDHKSCLGTFLGQFQSNSGGLPPRTTLCTHPFTNHRLKRFWPHNIYDATEIFDDSPVRGHIGLHAFERKAERGAAEDPHQSVFHHAHRCGEGKPLWFSSARCVMRCLFDRAHEDVGVIFGLQRFLLKCTLQASSLATAGSVYYPSRRKIIICTLCMGAFVLWTNAEPRNENRQ